MAEHAVLAAAHHKRKRAYMLLGTWADYYTTSCTAKHMHTSKQLLSSIKIDSLPAVLDLSPNWQQLLITHLLSSRA